MAQSRKPPVIDCHALAGAGNTWYEPAQQVEYDLELLLDRGAEAGIDRHCIMAARNETYEAPNKEIARLCEKHPERLTGFAVHSPDRERGRIREMLTAEVKQMGLRAVRCDGPPNRELVDTAAELGIPVVYYPRLASGQSASRYYHTLVSAYPDVAFVLPHLGQFRSSAWWAHIDALDLVKRYRNVYVDTAGVGSVKYLEMAVKDIPIDRILFGTSAPELDPRVEMEAVRLCKLPAKAYAAVMGGNIMRLLREKA